jgi:uncharacterized delta-60 repeat protein
MKKNKILIALIIQLFSILSVQTGTVRKVYVCNNLDEQLDLINDVTGTINNPIGPIGLGTNLQPLGIAITPDRQYAYVSCADNVANQSYVVAVQLSNNSIAATILINGVNANIGQVVITPDGRFVYVCQNQNGTVSAIQTSNNTLVGTYSFGFSQIYSIAISPNYPTSNTGFVGELPSNTLAPFTINTSTGALTGGTPFTVGSGTGASGLTYSPDGSKLYLLLNNGANDTLYGINSVTQLTVGSVTVGGRATATAWMVISPNGNTAYTPSSSSSLLYVINLNSFTVTSNSLVVGTNPSYISIASNGLYLYTSSLSANTVIAVSTATNTVTNTYTTSSTPYWTAAVASNPGTLDTTFGNQGFTLTPISRADSLSSALIQTGASINKIVIAGTTQISATGALTPSSFLAQYTTGGFLDTSSFNNTGANPGYQTLLIGTRTQANAVTLDANQNMLVAGYAMVNNLTNLFLARYNIAGSLDTTFNTVGYVTQLIGSGVTASAVGVQSTGKIIVAGTSVNSGVPAFTVARFTSAGALDSGTFGTGGFTTTNIGNISIIKAIIVDSSDKIVVAGVVDNKITIARYTAAGILDTTFNTTGILQPSITGVSSSTAYDIGLDASGNILVAGSVVQSGGTNSLLMRITTTGALDTTFNTTGYIIQSISGGSEFYSLVVQSNASIVAGGYAISPLANQLSLARYGLTGVLDTTYGTTGIALTSIGSVAAAQAIGLQTDQSCVTAGTADGTFYVARFTS